MDRVSSGILNLDKLTGGGFKRESINLVIGDPGSGKTIFAIEFLLAGLKKGESVIYITFEEIKYKLYEDMLTFGWDLAKYEKKGKFIFLEYTPEQVKNVLEEGGGLIESTIEKIKATRLVIDSITSFSLLYKDELTKKESALALFDLIRKWNCTALLTAQAQSRDNNSISSALEFEVDSVILLYHTKKEGLRKRAIEILKMRATKHPEKVMLLDITSKGLNIFPNKIVKI